MPRRVLPSLVLAALAPAALLTLPACGGAGPDIPAEMELVLAVEQAGQSAYAEGRFEDAVRLYTEGAARIDRDGSARVAGWRDRALYNAACSMARLGRTAEAAATFAKSIEHGIRAPQAYIPGQGWADVGAVTFEHILADPDLDRVRAEPAFRRAVEPYLSAGALEIDLGSALQGVRQPAILVLGAPEPQEPWELEVPEGGLVFGAVPPPIAPKGAATDLADRRWILGDGDERWALARIREALTDLADDDVCDPARIYVAGHGAESGTAALHALLTMPDRAAGFVVFGARFHPAAIADDVALLAKRADRPRIALGAGDAALRDLFAAHGVATETATDPAAAIAAWLAPPR